MKLKKKKQFKWPLQSFFKLEILDAIFGIRVPKDIKMSCVVFAMPKKIVIKPGLT